MSPTHLRGVLGVLLALSGLAASALTISPVAAAVTPSCSSETVFTLPDNVQLAQAHLSGDGSRISFPSTADIGGANPNTGLEIWVVDVDTHTAQPVTSTPTTGSASVNTQPTISHDGLQVAFRSTVDLVPSGNTDHNNEVYVATQNPNTQVWSYEQITTTTGGLVGGAFAQQLPVINADGDAIAFLSSTDITGQNADGNLEVMLWEEGSPDTTTQITNTTGEYPNGNLGISGDGSTVAFSSSANLTGANTDGGDDVFRYVVGDGTQQLTDLGSLADFDALPGLSGDGDRVFFASDASGLGTNPDGSDELYRWDEASGLTTKLTSAPAGSIVRWPWSNQFGSAAAFESNGALVAPADGQLYAHRWAATGGITRMAYATDSIGSSASPSTNAIGNLVAYAQFAPGEFPSLAVATCETFDDVGAAGTFYEDIEWMVGAEVSTGFSDGTYRPSAAVTRAAMSAFMYRLAGSPAFSDPGTPSFNDVPSSSQFFTEIEWMKAEGITNGFAGGLYKPNQAVTRQSMSAFMYRLAGEPAFVDPVTPSFVDVAASSTFFTEIEWMVDEDITNGFAGGLFKPAQDVTRQAMSAFMRRLYEGPGLAQF